MSARQGKNAVRDGRVFYVAPVDETLERAKRLADDFGVAVPAELASLENRAAALAARERSEGPDPEARRRLCLALRSAARINHTSI